MPTQRQIDFEKYNRFDGSMTKERFIKKHSLSPGYYQLMWLNKGFV